MPLTRQTAEALMDVLTRGTATGDRYESIVKLLAQSLGDHRFDQPTPVTHFTAKLPESLYMVRAIARQNGTWSTASETAYINRLRAALAPAPQQGT